MIKSTKEAIAASQHSSMLLLGPAKTGKSSFTASGTANAPDSMYTKEPVDASDVVLINIDAGGYMGAVDSGYRPSVIDLSHVRGYAALNLELAKAIKEIQPLAAAGKIKVVGLDLGAVAAEILAFCAGDKVLAADKLANTEIAFSGMETNWSQVTAQGVALYRAFRQIPCLVVGMAHVKITDNNPYKAKLTGAEKAAAELGRDVVAVGGDASKVGADLPKGILAPWVHNASYIFSREVREVNKGTGTAPKMVKEYVTHTTSDGTQTAGNRRQSVLPSPTDKSLRWLLDAATKID